MANRYQELYDLLPAYVLGSLEDEDRARVESWLESADPELEAELAAWVAQLEALAATASPHTPSARARRELLDRVQKSERIASSASPTNRWWMRLAAVLTLLVLGWLAVENRSLREQIATLSEQEDRLRTDARAAMTLLEDARRQLSEVRRSQLILTAPRSQSVLLAGLEAAQSATGQTWIDPDREQAVFFASGLPALPEAKVYQLWAIAGDVPQSAGIFDLDADGRGTLTVDEQISLDQVEVWAVTIEPAGGVSLPTGTMVLKS